MTTPTFTQIKMLPSLKETVWGGSRLEKEYGKNKKELANIAESWELSAINGMESVATGGVFDNTLFSEIYKKFNENAECPVLIKFIDSSSALSIQVHPSKKDKDALPKNECWYILSADEDSEIAYGVDPSVTPDDLSSAIADETLCEKLNYVKVNPGDFFYVPAGMVHAIGKGITLLEIQQSSDTTYRLYDYGRTDASGKRRELHVDKAIASVKSFTERDIASLCFSKGTPECDCECLCNCDYFSVYRITSEQDCSSIIRGKNASLTFLSDGSMLCNGNTITAKKGETFYISPSNQENKFTIISTEAVLTVI